MKHEMLIDIVQDLKRGEQEPDQHRQSARRDSLKGLPEGVFVWLDEFQNWYSSTDYLPYPVWEEQHPVIGEDDDPEPQFLQKRDDALDLFPISLGEFEPLVSEGFETGASPILSAAASPTADITERAPGGVELGTESLAASQTQDTTPSAVPVVAVGASANDSERLASLNAMRDRINGPAFKFDLELVEVESGSREKVHEHYAKWDEIGEDGTSVDLNETRLWKTYTEGDQFEKQHEVMPSDVFLEPPALPGADETASDGAKLAKAGQMDQKPWLIANPKDPTPAYHWYTPARYFARQLVIQDSTLLFRKPVLAQQVAKQFDNFGIHKRGGKKSFDPSTVLKAFINVELGKNSQTLAESLSPNQAAAQQP